LSRENWKGTGLHDLVEAALEPFGVANGGRSKRFVITGKNIRLPANEALALGIAFHELATNAVKYGAFSNAAGSIALTWTIEPTPEGDHLILCWQEKDGPPVILPTRKGFGSRVLERGLPHELGGSVQLDYHSEGCTINIPAPPVEGDWDG
jgi:two-component sensor histidine kinase